jgi:hypothetical protein
MVEATDFANRDDPTELRLLNWPAVGRILFERQVSARSVVVREVASQGTAQDDNPAHTVGEVLTAPTAHGRTPSRSGSSAPSGASV